MRIILITISLVLIVLLSCLLHELAHYFAMRKFNIDVEEISLGFGPKIFQKKIKNIYFSIRLGFLFGAYVKPANFFNIVKSNKHTILEKICIILSGIMVNLVLAVIFKILYEYVIFIEGYESLKSLYFDFISLINFTMTYINLLPIFGISDGSKMVDVICDRYFSKKVGKTLKKICNITGGFIYIYYIIIR